MGTTEKNPGRTRSAPTRDYRDQETPIAPVTFKGNCRGDGTRDHEEASVFRREGDPRPDDPDRRVDHVRFDCPGNSA
jgi:hypothetical protein